MYLVEFLLYQYVTCQHSQVNYLLILFFALLHLVFYRSSKHIRIAQIVWPTFSVPSMHLTELFLKSICDPVSFLSLKFQDFSFLISRWHSVIYRSSKQYIYSRNCVNFFQNFQCIWKSLSYIKMWPVSIPMSPTLRSYFLPCDI